MDKEAHNTEMLREVLNILKSNNTEQTLVERFDSFIVEFEDFRKYFYLFFPDQVPVVQDETIQPQS